MMARTVPWRALGAAVLIVGGAAIALRALGGGRPQLTARTTIALAATLGGDDTAGYARALEPRPFVFPQDDGPHPEFRTEWWYVTGNLESDDGLRLGWQLTFFRSALAPDMPDRASPWATRQAWMAHFAVTDGARGQHHAFERFGRGANGLAGAEASPFRVWLDAWTLRADAAAAALFPLRAVAADGSVAIDLVLTQGKPRTLQGERGLSRKGAESGNASYYWSFTRLPTTGTVRIGERTLRVQGESWLDREWSTSALAPGVIGWDWFALQLDDASELMLYRLRREDGTTDPFSAGTLVAADGSARHLDAGDFHVGVIDDWTSPLDGAAYPARWRLRVPSAALDLDVVPIVPDQELSLSVRYWEGAVDVRGERDGAPIGGRGYVELTGYSATAARTVERLR